MVVAIDGPAGVGKSTISKRLAEENGIFYLNSGSFYRALTYKAFTTGLDIRDVEAILKMAVNCKLEIIESHLHLDGENVEPYLRSDAVEERVAGLSAIVPIRNLVNQVIVQISKSLDIVVEGRDMTTVVFPDAEVKVFLDASIETRAQRRFDQGTSELTYEELLAKIGERDRIDRNKEVGSLKIAKGALYLDTSDLTIEQVCEKVSARIKEL